MKLSPSLRKAIIDIVCLLYILLFVYAAMTKLLDFENFKIQLGQSPILVPFSNTLAWLVPVFELIIATILLSTKFRLLNLIISYAVMVTFSFYIFIMLKFSEHVPCSCGGILEKLGWYEHLWFNITFCILALIALSCLQSFKTNKS